MKTIGMLTTALVAAGVVAGVVVGIRSVPDFQRYLRIRSM
jgi:hypothetical protein